MADAYVAVTDADGTRQLIDNSSVTTTAGAVKRQRVEIANPTADPETGLAKDATLTSGALRVGGTTAVSLATNTPDVTDRAGRLLGHVTVDSLPAGGAQDGTDISAPTAMPAGGAGIRGWLSAIWTKLNGTLAVSMASTPGLTDTQLRASAVPISAASLPLPTGAATLSAMTDGSQRVGGTVSTQEALPAAADILSGAALFGATTAATTLITIPSGRTWVGKVGASCACQVAAASTVAGRALATFTTAGSNVTPAAGLLFTVEAKTGANAAAGTVGTQGNVTFSEQVVVAAGASSATIQVATAQAGTVSGVSAWCIGRLV